MGLRIEPRDPVRDSAGNLIIDRAPARCDFFRSNALIPLRPKDDHLIPFTGIRDSIQLHHDLVHRHPADYRNPATAYQHLVSGNTP